IASVLAIPPTTPTYAVRSRPSRKKGLILRRLDPFHRLALGFLQVLTAGLFAASVAQANATTACVKDTVQTGPISIECADEDGPCGTDWACKALNVTARHPQGGCVCWKRKSSWFGCFSGGSWESHANAAPAPLTTVDFALIAGPGNVHTLVDWLDTTEDGNISRYQSFSNPSDFTGQYQLTFGSGPQVARPVRITNLNLAFPSFDCGGAATGQNTVVLGPGGNMVNGTANLIVGTIFFNQPVPCTIFNDLWPSGHATSLDPAFVRGAGGQYRVIPQSLTHVSSPVGVDHPQPSGVSFSIVPNPAQHTAIVTLSLPGPERVAVGVYDVSGRVVRTLIDDEVTSTKVAQWDLRDNMDRSVRPGTYFIRLRRASGTETRTLILMP
ncbi:MAG TPA: T9SS type A sorting domain-containing protein, partial [Candidatus Limnocylindria bacterium]|nr:T9SS type A sorting domain-containing protein [Candidatus Limnocylindria bacterium]